MNAALQRSGACCIGLVPDLARDQEGQIARGDRRAATPAGRKVRAHPIEPGPDVVGRSTGLDLADEPQKTLLDEILGGRSLCVIPSAKA